MKVGRGGHRHSWVHPWTSAAALAVPAAAVAEAVAPVKRGERRSLHLACHCWWSRAKVGGGSGARVAWLTLLAAKGKVGEGGSSACFACISWLVLVGVGGVLGVVHWRGDWRQCWGIGGALGRQGAGVGASAAVRWQLHPAGWAHWHGSVVRASAVGRWRGGGIIAALAPAH
jgi:hypothetical protein